MLHAWAVYYYVWIIIVKWQYFDIWTVKWRACMHHVGVNQSWRDEYYIEFSLWALEKEKRKGHEFVKVLFCLVLLSPLWEIWVALLGKAQQPKEQCCPYLSMCVAFLCVQTMVWVPVFGIFNMHPDIDTYNCTWGLYGHHKRDCSEIAPIYNLCNFIFAL